MLTLRIEFLVPLGSALRRHFTFCARSTGAKVSGKKNPRVQDLAKIIVTQKTQRQPKELVMILEGEKTVGISINHFTGDETKHAQATNNRAKHGPKEDGRGEHTGSDAPIHGIPRVRDDAGAVGEWCDSKEAAEKARDQ